MVGKRAVLLDSSALINGLRLERKENCIISSKCFSELKSMELRLLAENYLDKGFLKIQDSCPSSVQSVLDFLEKIGEKRLSDADVSLLSLAVEFKEKKANFIVLTDDHSLQNSLKILKIPYSPVLQGSIKKPKKWKK